MKAFLWKMGLGNSICRSTLSLVIFVCFLFYIKSKRGPFPSLFPDCHFVVFIVSCGRVNQRLKSAHFPRPLARLWYGLYWILLASRALLSPQLEPVWSLHGSRWEETICLILPPSIPSISEPTPALPNQRRTCCFKWFNRSFYAFAACCF